MRTSVQIVTQPAIEPVTLDQVRGHFRVDTEIEDAELTLYATSARAMAEKYLNRPLITTGFLWTIAPDHAPARPWSGERWHGAVEFPRGSVQTISSIKLTDNTGTQTTLPAAAYLVDLGIDPARLRFLYNSNLIPTVAPLENFQISFTAGYGSAPSAVPPPIVNAILITALFLYERRGDDGGEMPRTAEWLMDPYRVNYFGG